MLTIYDILGNKRADVATNDSSTQQKEVQNDNVLNLSFTHYEHVALDVNDYTDFQGERYWLQEKYAPKQKSEGEWEYDIKMYGIESLIKRFLVLETTDGDTEPEFTLTATPKEHVAMIVKCINDGMGNITDWKVGQVDGTENIVIDYQGKYCDEALKEIAEAVGGQAEWWVEGQTFNVCRCEHGEEITLAYGKGLTDIERDTSNVEDFYTRLFPIGSTRNIDPEKYGYSRLMLPGGEKYVEIHTDEYGIFDRYEKDAFSEIYPRRIGTVSSVRSEDTTDDDGNDFTIYYFKDDSLDFDPNDYELAGEAKRVSFQDGELAGLGDTEDHYFEVNYDSDTKEFEIITIWPYDDDTQLPGGNLVPKVGDSYILWNITMPDEYYTAAEEEFAEAVAAYNEEKWQDISVYKASTDHVYIEDNVIELYLGLRVKLESEKYFPETGYRSSRITKITRNVNLPGDMDIEISDALQSGALDRVNNSVSELKSYVRSSVASSSLPDIIRSWDNTLPTDTNLFSARRSQKEFLSKKNNDTASGKIGFLKGISIGDYVAGKNGGDIDEDGNAELLTLVIRELLRSTKFVDGLTGEGFQMWIDSLTGLAHLTVDKMTIRQTLTALELLIEKVRSIGGQFIVSAANGKIKEVTSSAGYYTITFEQSHSFVAGDLMRCATYTGTSQTSYWVEIASVSSDSVTVATTEFDDGVAPKAGDECVLMGNVSNKLRQNLISISATEDGQPRVDVLDGVHSKSFSGCLRCRFGNLDGISDNYFPADRQPSGNGLYGDNVFLHGTFVLMTGEDVLTKFEVVEGKITSAVESLRKEVLEDQSYLDNTAFANGMDKWYTDSEATFLTLGSKWLWMNGAPLSRKPGGHADVVEDNARSCAYIRNNYIMQKLEDFRYVPEYEETNSDGLRIPGLVYLSFYYKVIEAGRLTITFEDADKTGFENFNMFSYDAELDVTDSYKLLNNEGLWNGTGNLKIAFTGIIHIAGLVFSTNKVDALAYKYQTLFEQSDRLVKISAAIYDKDETALQETGLVIKPEGAGLYAQDSNGTIALIGVSVEEEDEDGNTTSKIKLTADHIQLEGLVTANENFKILEDGSIESVNGKFKGEIDATSGKLGGFEIASGRLGIDRDGTSEGMFLYDTMIGFNGTNMQAIIGTYSTLGTRMLGRFSNTAEDYLPNYGIVFNVSGSQSEQNYAFSGVGAGVLNGLMCGYSMQYVTCVQDTVTILGLLRGNKYIVYNTVSNTGVGIPLLSSVRDALNISSSTTFGVIIVIAVSHDATSNVPVYGKNSTVDGMNTDSHAQLYNKGGTAIDSMSIQKGQCIPFFLTYDGSSYKAFIVSEQY
ncbi:MAG: hypothetical protein Q4D41_00265 [Prevotellaceae bacterium]|nr:hypothetical protein [Prevotellaceae bacterium]